jgi:hypothetical protein
MKYAAINLREKFANFADCWSPKIVAQMNDCHFKLVIFQGDFVWHSHADTDEAFIAIRPSRPYCRSVPLAHVS